MNGNEPLMLAACGMNCSFCRGHMRKRNPCPGCRLGNQCKPRTRLDCQIKNCPELKKNGYEFCFSCEQFPCFLVNRMDKRYRKNYGVSLISNLERIKAVGVEIFLSEEKLKWTCSDCGAALCIHNKECSNCGKPRKS